IAVLSWPLPGALDGLHFCSALRTTSPRTRIIVLSETSGEDDIIGALEAGADGYLVKPCTAAVLLATICAHLRRSEPTANTSGIYAIASPLLKYETLVLDTVELTARVGGEPIELTRQQFQMLAYMLVNVGRVIPREEFRTRLFRAVQAERSASIRKQINHLRGALGAAGALIETVRGVGYGIGLGGHATGRKGRGA